MNNYAQEFCLPKLPDDFWLDYIRHNFHYNFITGFLYKKGKIKPIGARSSQGYLVTRLGPLKNKNEKKNFKVHHICWYLDNDFIWPANEIDHINGIRNDNRRENLKIVNRKENLDKRVYKKNEDPF